MVADADAVRAVAVSCAPFGIPVEPDVESMTAMSVAMGSPALMTSQSMDARAGSVVGMGRSDASPRSALSNCGYMVAMWVCGGMGSGASGRVFTMGQCSKSTKKNQPPG